MLRREAQCLQTMDGQIEKNGPNGRGAAEGGAGGRRGEEGKEEMEMTHLNLDLTACFSDFASLPLSCGAAREERAVQRVRSVRCSA